MKCGHGSVDVPGGVFSASAPSGSYGTPHLFGQRGYSSMSDNIAGTLAFAELVNVKDGRASKLCVRLGSAALDAGVSHYAFPSDSFARSSRGTTCDVRGKVSDDERV